MRGKTTAATTTTKPHTPNLTCFATQKPLPLPATTTMRRLALNKKKKKT